MPIRVRDLTHIRMRGTPFETTALRDVSLEIAPGSCVGIAGRTGSGKSTLVQHLNGVLKPSSGGISVGGIEVTEKNRKELRRRVGMVFQHPEQQLFEATVYREIAFGLSHQAASRAEIDDRIAEALALVGLGEELLDKSPFRLSGGQKRRVAIAAVLARRPEILILDEPGAGLDPRGRKEIVESIAKRQRELGFTLLLVSNSLEELVPTVDRLVVLRNGGVALEGTTREVLGNSRALQDAGMTMPIVTAFMTRLRASIPELSDCILSAEEARDELKRVLGRTPRGDATPC